MRQDHGRSLPDSQNRRIPSFIWDRSAENFGATRCQARRCGSFGTETGPAHPEIVLNGCCSQAKKPKIHCDYLHNTSWPEDFRGLAPQHSRNSSVPSRGEGKPPIAMELSGRCDGVLNTAVEVRMPDRLWTDRSLADGAKILWCLLRGIQAHSQDLAYADLRDAVGITQSLLRYIHALSERGWLEWRSSGVRCIRCTARNADGGSALSLPLDLISDRRLACSARLVWGVIRRHRTSFTYALLRDQTGHNRDSLSKYIRQLRETGWLVGSIYRKNRRTILQMTCVNPYAIQRELELKDLNRALELAKRQEGYSLGQCLMAWMVRVGGNRPGGECRTDGFGSPRNRRQAPV